MTDKKDCTGAICKVWPNGCPIKNKDIFVVKIGKNKRRVCICDGEKMFNEPGLSHGFIHFYDPYTKRKVGFAGINWFNKYAKIEEVK